jgi:hypothetical protein
MDITIVHRDFKTQLLVLRAPGYFGLPSLLLNGVPVKKSDGAYTVLNDAGLEVAVTVRTGPFDVLPQLLIEYEDIQLTGKPGWSQFAGWRRSSGIRLLAMASALIWRSGRLMLSSIRTKKLRKSVQS